MPWPMLVLLYLLLAGVGAWYLVVRPWLADRRRLIADCDQQVAWVALGDPRGVSGRYPFDEPPPYAPGYDCDKYVVERRWGLRPGRWYWVATPRYVENERYRWMSEYVWVDGVWHADSTSYVSSDTGSRGAQTVARGRNGQLIWQSERYADVTSARSALRSLLSVGHKA